MNPLIDPTDPLWEPLRAVIEEIAAELPRAAGDEPSLAGGLTGMALFQAYRHREQPRAPGVEWVEQWLSQSVDRLSGASMPPVLYGGYAGIAWGVQHMREELGIPDDEDPVAEIDQALLALLSTDCWPGSYDLIGGLVGFGVYALERLSRGEGAALLERVVTRLEELARSTPDGMTWHVPAHLLPEWQRKLYPSGHYNLGLAHGVPGILLLLARACAHGIAADRARPLLEQSLRWLRAQRRPEDGGDLFDSVIPTDGPRPSRRGRVAWCYGDLGLSVALLQTARTVGDTTWEQEALSAARLSAGRPFEQSGVVDAGLCHGAAGNAHLFHRLYLSTGEAVFREAARAWLARVLELRRPGEGISGFPSWNSTERGSGWYRNPGFLTGTAGVGLVLLAATGTVEPRWDRVLMASTA